MRKYFWKGSVTALILVMFCLVSSFSFWGSLIAKSGTQKEKSAFTELHASVTRQNSLMGQENKQQHVTQLDEVLRSQYTVASYADLAARLGEYADATEDTELVLSSDFPLDTMTEAFTVPGNTGGYTLTISSDGDSRVVIRRSAAVTSHLFTLENSARLILRNLILDGGKHDAITADGSFIYVNKEAELTTENTILQNNATTTDGGAVMVRGGSFIMLSGAILANEAKSGGGIQIRMDSGRFMMESGEITDNVASVNGGALNAANSGDIYINDGSISRNTANNGGGVYNSGTGSITELNGGEICGNTAFYSAGGVYSGAENMFTMKGGRISGNHAGSRGGGGVYVDISGTFIMENGEICFNSAVNHYGSEVFLIERGLFAMYNGLIIGEGSRDNSVTFPAQWVPEKSGDGLVIRFSGEEGDIFLYDDHESLQVMPEQGAHVVWNIQEGRHGFSYVFRDKAGFVELPVTVRYALEAFEISGNFRFGETLSAPESLKAPPAGTWGNLSYQWTRDGVDIEGAESSLYQLVEADIGARINVKITAENGYAPVSSQNENLTKKAVCTERPPEFTLAFVYDALTNTFGVEIPKMSRVEYSFDGVHFSDAYTITGIPGQTVTAYRRYAETATHEAGEATRESVVLPIMVTSITVKGLNGDRTI